MRESRPTSSGPLGLSSTREVGRAWLTRTNVTTGPQWGMRERAAAVDGRWLTLRAFNAQPWEASGTAPGRRETGPATAGRCGPKPRPAAGVQVSGAA